LVFGSETYERLRRISELLKVNRCSRSQHGVMQDATADRNFVAGHPLYSANRQLRD
jgi:hypothetical protein